MVFGWNFQRLLDSVSVVQRISLSLACPFHCGSSILPWFFLGLALGLILGFSCACWAFCYLYFTCWNSPSGGSAPPSRFPSSAVRLRGYLHERQLWSFVCSFDCRSKPSDFCGLSCCSPDRDWGETRSGGGDLGVGRGVVWATISFICSVQFLHLPWHPCCLAILCWEAFVHSSWSRCSCQACLRSWISCKKVRGYWDLVCWCLH